VNGDGKLDLVAVDYCASRTCNGDGSLLSILLATATALSSATNVPTDNYPSAAPWQTSTAMASWIWWLRWEDW